MRIRDFRGLRPPQTIVGDLASPPYDVVTTAETRSILAEQPGSFLRVVRAEATLPEGIDAYDPQVYAAARRNFVELQRTGELIREEASCLYVYRQEVDGHVQQGVVALCHADEYESGLIRKHERTRPEKEDDRVRLNLALSAHAEPVFLTFRATSQILDRIDAVVSAPPLLAFKASDGVSHTLWRVEDPAGMVADFSSVPHCYIADGHHRSAGAARVANARKQDNPEHHGGEDYNWFPAVLFPDHQLRVLPYNRLVSDLNGLSIDEFLSRVGETCLVSRGGSPSPASPGIVSMYLGGEWFELRFENLINLGPIDRLDVSLLQDRILGPILGIDDPRTNKRIDFAGGIRGTEFLRLQVDAGHAAVAFSMHPVTVQQLMDVADLGQIMPPKSTWFEPKLRSGLFVHTF